MSVTQYTPVSFAPGDPLTTEKLNALANNVQLLNERTAKVLYKGHGVTKDKGIRIYSTVLALPKNTRSGDAVARIYFGNFFSTACKPLVTATVNSYPQDRFHTVVCGHGPTIPDHRGVAVLVSADERYQYLNKIHKTIYVNVLAVGW